MTDTQPRTPAGSPAGGQFGNQPGGVEGSLSLASVSFEDRWAADHIANFPPPRDAAYFDQWTQRIVTSAHIDTTSRVGSGPALDEVADTYGAALERIHGRTSLDTETARHWAKRLLLVNKVLELAMPEDDRQRQIDFARAANRLDPDDVRRGMGAGYQATGRLTARKAARRAGMRAGLGDEAFARLGFGAKYHFLPIGLPVGFPAPNTLEWQEDTFRRQAAINALIADAAKPYLGDIFTQEHFDLLSAPLGPVERTEVP